MNRKLHLVTGAVLAGIAQRASGHSFVVYYSTPVSPPDGYQWVLPVALGLLFVANALLLWRLRLINKWASPFLALAAVSFFAAAFYAMGDIASSMTTVPFPGLGPPGAIYRGWGWSRLGQGFIAWNLLGLATLLVSTAGLRSVFEQAGAFFWGDGTVLRFLKSWTPLALILIPFGWVVARGEAPPLPFLAIILVVLTIIVARRASSRRAILSLLAVNAVAYILALAPFIATWSLAHGWAGGYVHMGCMDNVRELHVAIARYAAEHDGRFPEADSFEQLYGKIRRYVESDSLRYGENMRTCPVAAAFLAEPATFKWNSQWSGQSISAFTALCGAEWEEKSLVGCPYHRRSALTGLDFEDIVEEVESSGR